jgi:riboflavin kinase / FMN adenylyltransferase
MNVSVTGTVVKGVARGRVLGYPTANLDTVSHKLNIGSVYHGNVMVDTSVYIGVLCVNWENVVEVHILDFPKSGEDNNLYGKVLHVNDIVFLRKMAPIKDEEELLKVIGKDVQDTRNYYL